MASPRGVLVVAIACAFLMSVCFSYGEALDLLDPRFDDEAINVTVREGRTAVLPCSVYNLGGFKVAWSTPSRILTLMDRRMVNDNRLSVERPYSQDWNLHLRNVRYEDRGLYTCIINTRPMQTKNVYLDVPVPQNSPPTTTEGTQEWGTVWPLNVDGPKNVTAREGDNATFQCRVLNDPEADVVRWTKVDQLTRRSRHLTTEYGSQVLTIERVQKTDEGQYRCVTGNLVGLKYTTAWLTVLEPVATTLGPRDPGFDDEVLNVTVEVGRTAVLPCSVNNLGEHEVIWTDQYSTLLTYMDRRIVDDSRLSVERPYARDWNLHFQDVRYRDQGVYMCQINTQPVRVVKVYLNVQDPRNSPTTAATTTRRPVAPEVYLPNMRIGQQAGKYVILECSVSGHPISDVWWERNGERINNKEHKYRVEIYHETLSSLSLNLWIHNLDIFEFGVYTCFASNRHGNDHQDMVLYDMRAGRTTPPVQAIPNDSEESSTELPTTPPETETETPAGAGILGKNTIIECAVASRPPARVVWKKDGEEIEFRDGKYDIITYQMSDTQLVETLRIISIETSDLGQYSCEAQVELGLNSEPLEYEDLYRHLRQTTTLRPREGYLTSPGSSTTRRFGRGRGGGRRGHERVTTPSPDGNWRQYGTSSPPYGRHYGTTPSPIWRQYGTSSPPHWGRDGTSSPPYGRHYGTTPSPFWRQYRTSSPPYWRRDGTSNPPYWRRYGTTPSPFWRQYRTSSPPYWRRYGTSNPPYWRRYGTTPSPFWRQYRTSSPPYWRRYGTSSPPYWRRYGTSSPPYWRRYGTTPSPFWRQYGTSSPPYWRRYGTSSPPYWRRYGTSNPPYWRRYGTTPSPFWRQYRTSSPPYWRRYGTSSPPYWRRYGTSSPPYGRRYGTTPSPFWRQYGTSSPPYWRRYGTSSPPYWRRYGTSNPPYWRRYGTTPSPFWRQYRTSSPPYWRRYGTSSPPYGRRYGTTPSPFWRQYGTSSPPYWRRDGTSSPSYWRRYGTSGSPTQDRMTPNATSDASNPPMAWKNFYTFLSALGRSVS